MEQAPMNAEVDPELVRKYMPLVIEHHYTTEEEHQAALRASIQFVESGTKILPFDMEKHEFPEDHKICIMPSEQGGAFDHCHETIIKEDLQKLQALGLAGAPKSVDWHGPVSEEVATEILDMLRYYNDLRDDEDDGRWKLFRFYAEDEQIVGVLDDPCFALFRKVCLYGNFENRLTPVPVSVFGNLDRLCHLTNMEAVTLEDCCVDQYGSTFLQNMIALNKMRRLTIDNVVFEHEHISAKHIAKGLELSSRTALLPRQNDTVLKSLDIICSFDCSDVNHIVKSLRGHRHIEELRLAFHDDCLPALQTLANDVLSYPGCNIDVLTVRCDSLMDDGEFSLVADAFLTKDTPVRKLTLPCPNGSHRVDFIRPAMRLALCKDNQIESFYFRTENKVGLPMGELPEIIEDCDRDNNVPDFANEKEAFVAFCHRFKVRSFEMDAFQNVDPSPHNLKSLLYLVEHRLPRLCNLGMWLNTVMAEEVRQKYMEGGRQDESLKPCVEVSLWLERNRMGRALLHPSLSNSVPLGFWSIVLESAWNKCDASVDGVLFMVQGLVMGGIIGSNHTDRGSSTTTNSESDSKSDDEGVDRQSKRARLGLGLGARI
jgi:hypothetical protein